MTYHKEMGEEANKKGKAEGIVRLLPAPKIKMQVGWKDKWKVWLAFGKLSCLGIFQLLFTYFSEGYFRFPGKLCLLKSLNTCPFKMRLIHYISFCSAFFYSHASFFHFFYLWIFCFLYSRY